MNAGLALQLFYGKSMSVASEHVDKQLKIAEAMFNNLPTFTHTFTTAQLCINRAER